MLTEGNQTHNLPVTQPFTNILYQPIQTENAASITTALHATANTAGLPIIAKPVVAITQLEVAPNQQLSNFPLDPNHGLPIRSFLLECEVSSYPDKIFVRQFIDDLLLGCSIGYTGPQFAHLANNLPSAYQQPSVIDATLEKECEAGRILGTFSNSPLENFRTSGLVVPKHNGGWRIIYHLSAPDGLSINDFIDTFSYSLKYCSIDDACTIINKLGPGALLSKIDLKDAFRLIPVQSSDWNLLEICWRQKFYIDTCLPFGLRSAPYLFNRLSTALHWIFRKYLWY